MYFAFRNTYCHRLLPTATILLIERYTQSGIFLFLPDLSSLNFIQFRSFFVTFSEILVDVMYEILYLNF